jgi:hypothetical protein
MKKLILQVLKTKKSKVYKQSYNPDETQLKKDYDKHVRDTKRDPHMREALDLQGVSGHIPASMILEDALTQTLPVIEHAYNSLPDDETKAVFEEQLLKNIQLYIEKWKEEREESDMEPLELPAVTGQSHRQMRRLARQGKYGIPPHE